MPILFMLIMLVLIWFGFHLLAAIITSVAPGAAFLFHDNGIATFIFSLSLCIGFPLVVCVPIAIIAGFIFAETWYTTVLQYLTLEAMLAILSVIATLVFGAGSEIAESISRKRK